MNKRILELALKGLEVERATIDDDIAEVRRELGAEPGEGNRKRNKPARSTRSNTANERVLERTSPHKVSKAPRGRSRLTAAGREKLSEAMKRRWAVKKKAAKKKV